MLVCQLIGVSKEWDGKPLFERVNIEIHEGQRVCLIGRNGAGKTTLLAGIMNRVQVDSTGHDNAIHQSVLAAMLSLQNVSFGYGHRLLFTHGEVSVCTERRTCLNGLVT